MFISETKRDYKPQWLTLSYTHGDTFSNIKDSHQKLRNKQKPIQPKFTHGKVKLSPAANKNRKSAGKHGVHCLALF